MAAAGEGIRPRTPSRSGHDFSTENRLLQKPYVSMTMMHKPPTRHLASDLGAGRMRSKTIGGKSLHRLRSSSISPQKGAMYGNARLRISMPMALGKQGYLPMASNLPRMSRRPQGWGIRQKLKTQAAEENTQQVREVHFAGIKSTLGCTSAFRWSTDSTKTFI
jgi:hypothetical protein